MHITDVHFVAAEPHDVRRGLLGFLSFVLDRCLRLDSITVRRTRSGLIRLSFPVRHDAAGHQHPYIRPINDTARQEIEKAVLRSLPFLEDQIT
jgi:DNA-binding cell septation regulator SpoVG